MIIMNNSKNAFTLIESLVSVAITAIGFVGVYTLVGTSNTVISNINEYIRTFDVIKATKALDYLQEELAIAQNAEIKMILAMLIESEVQTITLSEATQYFAFEPIQTAYFPEEKIRPRKARMVMVGALLGLISTFFIILVLDFFKIISRRRF